MIREGFERILGGGSTHSPAYSVSIVPRGGAQYGPWCARLKNRVHKSLGLPRTEDQHGSLFNSALGSCFSTMQNEIGHRSTLQVCRLLEQDFLFFVETSIEAIGFRFWTFTFSRNGVAHGCSLLPFTQLYGKYPYMSTAEYLPPGIQRCFSPHSGPAATCNAMLERDGRSIKWLRSSQIVWCASPV
jgi:hypothetical protein